MERDSWWALVNTVVWAARPPMERDSWWALLNVAVWAVSTGYVEGHLVDNGECGGMGCIVRLWKVTTCGDCGMWRYGLYRAVI